LEKIDVNLSKNRQHWPLHIKLRRGFWTYAIQPIIKILPNAASPLRVLVLRAMGARIGRRCLISRGVRVLMPWNLALADFVAIGHDVDLYNFAEIAIGSNTVISQYAFLCTGSHDYSRSDMPLTYSPINIAKNCWIASASFIAPGVSIAEGTVVGARSVVRKSIDAPRGIWAGNPAIFVKERIIRPC
jgi:putative colanic acid biosynthesis acetyltransferase WcaF